MKAVKELARAKINLYLDVLSKREDGFHDIKTVMHTTTLSDEITLSLHGTGKRCVRLVADAERWLPTDQRNIAYTAAMLYMERAGIDAEIHIRLKKKIPVAAGLAGGSADAAAVLRGMNRLFGRLMSDKLLLSLAAQLGSDVPFCLLGGTALCYGRGERIERLPDGLSLSLVIAVANEFVSTPTAYSELDRLYSDFSGKIEEHASELDSLISAIRTGASVEEYLYNIFEDAVLPQCRGAARLKTRLIELGASATLMSGSGPSVFGIFPSDALADAAAEALRAEGVVAHSAKSG